MTTLLILLAILALFCLLARYARHDRFAGPGLRDTRDRAERIEPHRLVL